MRRIVIVVVLMAAAVAVLALSSVGGVEAQGAGGSGAKVDAPKADAPKDHGASSDAAKPAPDPFPNSPIGAHARWLVAALTKGGEGATEQAVLAYHADEFFEDRTAAELVETIRTMSMLVGAGKVRRVYSHKATAAFVRIETAAGSLQRLTLNCQPQPPHRITMWQLTPDPTPGYEAAPTDWDGFDKALGLLAKDTGYLLAEVKDGALVPIRSRNSDTRGNVASVHKLYTLGELCRQVAEGKATWDETMLLQDKFKVGGSGDLRDVESGTSLTLREYARKMISISDNTATDHLLNLLGRDAVEAMLATMGHSDPAATTPFLAVREAFALMGTRNGELIKAWRAGDVAARRKMLDEGLKDAGPLEFGGKPRNLDIAGWYASPSDMGRAMAYLRGRMGATGMEPLAGILRAPESYPRKGWKDMFFKGGSTTGVLAGSWLLQATDGRWFVWGVVANDTSKGLDEMVGIELFLEGVGIARQAAEAAKPGGGDAARGAE